MVDRVALKLAFLEKGFLSGLLNSAWNRQVIFILIRFYLCRASTGLTYRGYVNDTIPIRAQTTGSVLDRGPPGERQMIGLETATPPIQSTASLTKTVYYGRLKPRWNTYLDMPFCSLPLSLPLCANLDITLGSIKCSPCGP